ncbi:atpase f0 complex subunit a active site [Lucifera butyrica]|uniref:ATP synthase subunit a n=1 Tax=Lucifera butyrica TaxID=1351585 RepID=A0A498RCS9_9FIRM|nr:F0F1 ATP synthase subunit A [Lucifera butyrica]VBB09241.1 atpase f0 complex subunit a active site [Lucifera butyrica]
MGHGGGNDMGAHKLAHLAGLTFNMDTLYMTWLAMAIVILIAIIATRKLELVPRGWQNLLELAVTAILDQIEATMGSRGKKLAPLIITLFLFLLIANWLGLIPGLSSPTNDINTTLGLALMIVVLVHILGVKNRGAGNYVKHFFQPYIPFVFINLIEELAKPITLSFRLFGNILAGEILIVVLSILVPVWMPIPNILWLGFSVFVGLVQAFIFTMLSMSYLAGVTKDDYH